MGGEIGGLTLIASMAYSTGRCSSFPCVLGVSERVRTLEQSAFWGKGIDTSIWEGLSSLYYPPRTCKGSSPYSERVKNMLDWEQSRWGS